VTKRYRVAQLSKIEPGTMVGVNAGITPVLLANVEGTIYAIQNLCPHFYVPLVLGRLDGCVVTCAAHASKFDVRTGEVLEWVTGNYPLRAEQLLRLKAQKRATTYPVTIEGEDVFVEV
jgi:3-phenylpropionate/trans-cinnamate dioxygenase ferredoxin subunit